MRGPQFHIKLTTIIFFIICCSNGMLSQSDWNKWEKSENIYTVQIDMKERDYSFDNLSGDQVILKSTAILYWFFFSDLDGDNCPFHPSCSHFFIEASGQTNLFQGTLMFFDRFTRDASFAGREKYYPLYKNRKFFDPPGNYTLNKKDIKYHYPLTLILNEE